MPGKTDPVKKYWWLILVVVPLAVAVVQYGPSWGGSSTSGESRISDNQFNGAAIIGDVSVGE
jgi:hypothetical protein